MRAARSADNGKTWTELEPVGDWGGIVAMGSVVERKDGSFIAFFHDDGRYFRKDGSLVHVNVSTKAVRDASGQVLYFLSSKKDVTQLKVQLDQQQTAAGFGEGPVHATCFIGKYPVGHEPLRHARRTWAVVTLLDGHQGEEARTDCANDASVHRHARLQHPLNHCNHDAQFSLRRAAFKPCCGVQRSSSSIWPVTVTVIGVSPASTGAGAASAIAIAARA